VLSPSIPLIFMGEEWNATTPFFYFADLDDALKASVRTSRQELLERWDRTEPTPDPFDPEAFERTKLRWEERTQPSHSAFVSYYRELLNVRRTHLVPRLHGTGGH